MINPFTSSLYTATWLKYFKHENAKSVFNSFKGITFYKSKYLPLFINIGKNLTKGIDYTIDYSEDDYQGKTFLIYDVPEYFKLEPLDRSKTNLRLKEVFQYKGFALDFTEFPNPDDYIASRISAKNRRGYRSRLKRLEECFDIRYEFLFGEVEAQQFKKLFKQFHELLATRFSGKGVNYHHLEPQKWAFYTELVYNMLQKKQASLFTIYNGDKPIGVTLNFHSEEIAFVTITVFDPDYFKFNVGKASIVKLLEWSYEQDIKIMDFSKGEFDFKYEWCNLVYDFKYHILYDSKSIIATATANLVASFFKFKLYLREKNVNTLYRQFLHKIKGSKDVTTHNTNYTMSFVEAVDADIVAKIDIDTENYAHLKPFVYSFLFLNSQPLATLEVLKHPEKEDYYIKGIKKTQLISFNA